MPIGAGYQDASLDALVTGWPAGTFRLFYDDPALAALPSDVELASDGGYAPLTAAAAGADFAAASGGAKSVTLDFGTSTDAYSDLGVYWGLVDGAGALVYSDDLPTPVEVLEASVAVSVAPTLFFGQV